MQKILIIEDDHGIANSLKLYLESSSFTVYIENDGAKAIMSIKKYSPDVIILDLNLPGKDGIEIIQEYRKNGRVPVIMLTARSGELDRVRGLDLGADDYIAKPFSPRELLARIHTILRRIKPTIEEVEDNKSIITFELLQLNLDKLTATLEGRSIVLTSNEFEIIKRLIQKKGAILTREEIMKNVMGYENYIYDRTVDTHIKNLRKKMHPFSYIKTVRGTGYRLCSN